MEKLEISEFLQKVCEEFMALGFMKDVNPRTLKESYNIMKRPDGSWYKSTKAGLHVAAQASPLDLDQMPFLKRLTGQIDQLDADLKKNGGRVFITQELVFKIVKGCEYPLIINQTSDEQKSSGHYPYAKLCEELKAIGHEKDRHRIEETYIVSKTIKGEWIGSSSHENFSGTKMVFNLENMPQLKMLVGKLSKIDPMFAANGGRVFITPTRIYRIKNKVEIDFGFVRKK